MARRCSRYARRRATLKKEEGVRRSKSETKRNRIEYRSIWVTYAMGRTTNFWCLIVYQSAYTSTANKRMATAAATQWLAAAYDDRPTERPTDWLLWKLTFKNAQCFVPQVITLHVRHSPSITSVWLFSGSYRGDRLQMDEKENYCKSNIWIYYISW